MRYPIPTQATPAITMRAFSVGTLREVSAPILVWWPEIYLGSDAVPQSIFHLASHFPGAVVVKVPNIKGICVGPGWLNQGMGFISLRWLQDHEPWETKLEWSKSIDFYREAGWLELKEAGVLRE